MRHWANRRNFVCGSVIFVDISLMVSWTVVNCVSKYSLEKSGEPMGDPRRQNPVVSSTGRGGPLVLILLGFVEYCLIVLAMEVASEGLRVAMAGSGECPEVDVRILVFMGLTKQPNGAPMQLKLSHKNWRSSRGTQAETSSTYPRRWVMLPLPSSPIWLARRGALACSLRRASRGCRRRATTSEAKMGKSGQPWLTPFSIRRVHHVPSAHL